MPYALLAYLVAEILQQHLYVLSVKSRQVFLLVALPVGVEPSVVAFFPDPHSSLIPSIRCFIPMLYVRPQCRM